MKGTSHLCTYRHKHLLKSIHKCSSWYPMNNVPFLSIKLYWKCSWLFLFFALYPYTFLSTKAKGDWEDGGIQHSSFYSRVYAIKWLKFQSHFHLDLWPTCMTLKVNRGPELYKTNCMPSLDKIHWRMFIKVTVMKRFSWLGL